MTSTPVFVDASGRRAAVVRRTCWLLAALAMGYVVLVVVALVAPTDVLPLRLPGLPRGTAPALTTSDGATHPPAALATSLPTPSPRPTLAAPPASRTSPQPRATPIAVATTRPSTPASSAPRPSSTRAPSARPTPAATPPGRAVGRPTAKPTAHATPSKPPHP